MKEGNESVDNYKTSDNLRDDSVNKTTKKREALIKRSMTTDLKHHVINSVINIVPLCGKKMIELAKEN